MEPFELWQERLPARYKHMAWCRVTVDGQEKVQFFGNPTNFEWTIGSLCTPGALSAAGRLDIDLDTEVDPGVNDPTRRLELMDAQGIGASVLFPTMTLGLDDLPDPGFANASAHAYNGWVHDFASADPVRFRWAAVLPLNDLDWAAAELEWAIAEGATTIMLSPIPTPAGQSLGQRRPRSAVGAPGRGGHAGRRARGQPDEPDLGHRPSSRQPGPVADGRAVPVAAGRAARHRRWDARPLPRAPRGVLRGRRRMAPALVRDAWTRPTTRWP